MTRAGEHPMPWKRRRLMARLMQVHHLTRPEQIAAAMNVSAEYVRRQWRDCPSADSDRVAVLLRQLLSED